MSIFTEGQSVWYNGEIKTILSMPNKHTAVLGSDDVFFVEMVQTSKLKVVASDAFSIGEQVMSYYTFEGVVVGFEEETNRVIVRSNHANEDDRRRYAYKPSELRHSPVRSQWDSDYDKLVCNVVANTNIPVVILEPQQSYAIRLKGQHELLIVHTRLDKRNYQRPCLVVFKKANPSAVVTAIPYHPGVNLSHYGIEEAYKI